MKLKIGRCLTAVMTVLAAVPLVAAADMDPAEWVPADAVAYVGAENVGRLWSDFQKTAMYQAMVDPDLGSGGVPGALIGQLRERLAALLGVQASDLKNPFSGPLAVCVVPKDTADGATEFILVAGVSDAALAPRYFEAALAALKERAARHETQTLAGQQVHILSYPQRAGLKAEPALPVNLGAGLQLKVLQQQIAHWLDRFFSLDWLPESLALCLTADRLIVSASAKRIEQVLSLTPAKTLAGSNGYQLLLKRFRPLGQKRILVDLERAAELVGSGEAEDSALGKLLVAARQQGLRSVVGHVRLGTRAYEWKCELLLVTSGLTGSQGWLGTAENRSVTPPDWVPASAVAYLSLNADLSALSASLAGLGGLMAVAGSQMPAMSAVPGMQLPAGVDQAELMRQIEKMQEKMPPAGAPLPASVSPFAGLSGPLFLTLGFATPYKPGCARWLVTIGHRDQETIRQMLTALSAMAGAPAAAQEIKGVPVYTEPFSKATCAVTADRLLAGSRPAVEAALGETAAPEKLADEPGFVAARRLVPKEAWFVGYLDYPRLLKALSELARGREDLPPDSLEAMLVTWLDLGGVDWSDAAKFQKHRDHATAFIVTASTVSDGVLVTAVTLPPGGRADGSRP